MDKKLTIASGKEVVITPEGSLGLLALGDVGLRAWRKVRNDYDKTLGNEEE